MNYGNIDKTRRTEDVVSELKKELELEKYDLNKFEEFKAYIESDIKLTKRIESLSDEFIQLVLLSMMMTSNAAFYGMFLISMEKKYDINDGKEYGGAPASVSINNDTINLYINPKFIPIFTIKDWVSVLTHEVYHIMNCHLQRGLANKHDKFELYIENLAMDCAINQFISHTPKGSVTFDIISRDINVVRTHFGIPTIVLEEKREWEYYYYAILDSFPRNKRKEENKSLMPETVPPDHSKWDESDDFSVENMKSVVLDLATRAAKSAGNVPSNIQQIIDKLKRPAIIPWEKEFERMTGSVKVPYKKTPLRRDRRMMDRYDLKGRISDRKIKIAVAIDTSASISDTELSYIFSEIFNVIRTIKFELTIIECDAQIQRVYTAKTQNDVDTKVTGRGGTLFEPVFEYIKDEMKNKIDMLIYFTDGYGESEIKSEYKPRMYSLMWVITTSGDYEGRLSLKDPMTNKIKPLHIEN